jgi:hypothetical protein
MMLCIECPDEVFADLVLPVAMTAPGVLLEKVEHVSAGPWLAALLARVDVAQLTDWDMPAYLRACAKQQAWTAARLADGVAELAARPGGFGADKEVALALREPVGVSQRRLHFARRLRTLLPTTRALFRRGDLLEKHVDAIVEATAGVDDPELLAAVEEKVLSAPRALAKTATELRRDVRHALTRIDPDGAQDRARAARDNADVTFIPGEDGTGTTYVDGPVEEALIVKTAADAAAATAKAAGDPRPSGVLRSEGLARICSDYLTGRSSSGAPRAGGRPIELGIVVGLDTALGRRDLPGEVPGVGIVPREVIAQMVARELPKLRLLVIDEATGRLVYRATDGYRPTPEQVAHVRAAYVHSVGPGSQVLAGRTDTDHATPYPIGETVIGNLLPNDRTWHNGHTRQQLSVTLDDSGTVTWTSVLGQTRTVTPYDYRLEPDDPPSADPVADAAPDDDPPPF